MTESLSPDHRLEYRHFGVSEVVERKHKIGRNSMNTSVPIVIPACKAVKFTPGKKMRRLVEEELPAGKEETISLALARGIRNN